MSSVGTVSVMSALAVEVAFKRFVVPEFERTAGASARMTWDPTTVLVRRVGEGERADAILAIDGAMDGLADQGIIRRETRVPVARALLGIAGRAGAPRPDIATLEAFKAALLGARVAYSRGGASGIYFAALLDRLGIADAVNARAVTIPAGFTAEKVVSGEADLAVQQVSELMSVDGVDVVGPFPDEVQTFTDFSVAVFAEAANPEGAARFIEVATSAAASKAYEAGGLVSRVRPRGAS